MQLSQVHNALKSLIFCQPKSLNFTSLTRLRYQIVAGTFLEAGILTIYMTDIDVGEAGVL